MKTIKEVSNFGNEFEYYGQHNAEKEIDLNQERHCIVNVLSEGDLIRKDNCICVLGVSDDKVLMFSDGIFEIFVPKFIVLRVGISQLLCLIKLRKNNYRRWQGSYNKWNKKLDNIQIFLM